MVTQTSNKTKEDKKPVASRIIGEHCIYLYFVLPLWDSVQIQKSGDLAVSVSFFSAAVLCRYCTDFWIVESIYSSCLGSSVSFQSTAPWSQGLDHPAMLDNQQFQSPNNWSMLLCLPSTHRLCSVRPWTPLVQSGCEILLEMIYSWAICCTSFTVDSS